MTNLDRRLLDIPGRLDRFSIDNPGTLDAGTIIDQHIPEEKNFNVSLDLMLFNVTESTMEYNS